MKRCRPSSSTPRRFANVLSKKHRVKKKHCHRRVAEHELNRASQQQQPKKSTGNRRTGRRISFQSNCRFQC